MAPPLRLAVRSRAEAEAARRAARDLAGALGFGRAEAEAVALAVSELATNLARYAIRGELVLRPVSGPRGVGLEVESRDAGPGIAALDLALRDGHSTGGGLGSGLPAARRLLDEFAIATGPEGTTIVGRKWPGA